MRWTCIVTRSHYLILGKNVDLLGSPSGCARRTPPVVVAFRVLSVWWKTSTSVSVLFRMVLPHILRPGLKCGGWESKFGRGPGPHDRSGMGWSCLCLRYNRVMCFEVPSWDTLVHESLFPWDGMTWLWSSTIVRTRIWKVVKWFCLLNPCLKVEQVLT